MFEKLLQLPGDSAQLRQAADGHQAMSGSLRSIADRIGGADTTALTGSAADAARRKLQDAVTALHDQADQHASSASQMHEHADAMDKRQQSTVTAIEGLAAGIVAATVVGVALTWLTVGISDLVAASVAESSLAAATAIAIEYAVWLDSYIAGFGWIYANALVQAFTFQVFSELAGGKPVLGGDNEAGAIFGNAFGIAGGLYVGGWVGGAYVGAGAKPLAGLAGGATTGLINSTAVVGATGGTVDPATVAESVAFAGLLGAAGGALGPTRIPAVAAAGVEQQADVAGGTALGGGVFYDEVVAPAAVEPVAGAPVVPAPPGSIELVPLPGSGAGPSGAGGPAAGSAGPGDITGTPAATGSATDAGTGPGTIPSGGAAGQTPGAGSPTPGTPTPGTPGSVASDTSSGHYSDAMSQLSSGGSSGGGSPAGSAGGLPLTGLAGTAGSGSASSTTSNTAFQSLDEQDLAGFAVE